MSIARAMHDKLCTWNVPKEQERNEKAPTQAQAALKAESAERTPSSVKGLESWRAPA
jgi:hypothetical protein